MDMKALEKGMENDTFKGPSEEQTQAPAKEGVAECGHACHRICGDESALGSEPFTG